MATSAPVAVKSTGLTPAQTAQLSAIANSSSGAQQAYSTGKAPTAPTSGVNPHDAPGYNPANDPTTKYYDPNAQASTPTPTPNPATNINTTQPSPQTAQVQPPNANPDLASAIAGNGGALTSDQMNNPDTVQGLAQKYKQGLKNAQSSGIQAPDTLGGGMAGTKASTPTPPPEPPPVNPNVNNFVDHTTNQSMADQVHQLMDIVSPQATRDNLAKETANLTAEKDVLAQDKLQLMNVQNIMKGTQQDIRDEVTKANGFATNSQVLALTVARNSTLLKDAQMLQDQVTAQQDLINNDTTLLASDKADAANQLSTRMGLMQYIQTNQNNQLNAYKSGITTQINTPGGLTALASDPSQSAIAEKTMGWAPGTIASMQKAEASDTALKHAQLQATIDNTRATTAKTYQDVKNSSGLGGGLSLKDYTTTSSKGNSYIDLSTVSDKTEKKNVEAAARAQGIPVVTDANAAKMNAIEDTRNNLANISAQFDKIGYKSGTTKALAGLGFGLSNRVADLFGSTDVGSFKAWRTAAINSVQALAGGAGSGLRINAAEIAAATQNDIPNIGDTVAVGKAKMDVLKSQLDSWENTLLGSKDRSAGAGGSATDPLGLGI